MANETIESEGGDVLLKVRSRRFETMRVLPSGYSNVSWTKSNKGNIETNRNSDLSRNTRTLTRRRRRLHLPRRQAAVHCNLLEADRVRGVGDSVCSHRARDLSSEVEHILAADGVEAEGAVTGSRALCDGERGKGCEGRCGAVDRVNAHEVGTEVGDQQILPTRIEDGFVWVRRVLAAGHCAWGVEGVGEELGLCQMAGGGDVVGLQRAAGAVLGQLAGG